LTKLEKNSQIIWTIPVKHLDGPLVVLMAEIDVDEGVVERVVLAVLVVLRVTVDAEDFDCVLVFIVDVVVIFVVDGT